MIIHHNGWPDYRPNPDHPRFSPQFSTVPMTRLEGLRAHAPTLVAMPVEDSMFKANASPLQNQG